MTARYAAAVVPDLVASVTTVATPNTGAALADVVAGALPAGSLLRAVLVRLSNALANFIGVLSNDSQTNDSLNALNSLTTAGLAEFNAQYPAGMPTEPCGEGPAELNGQRLFLTATAVPYSLASDGLVDHCSSHFGHVIRDNYLMNHLDDINGTLGLVSPLSPSPVALFRIHANRLKNSGL